MTMPALPALSFADAEQIARDAFPDVDARRQEVITDAQADFFRQNGLLIIRNLLSDAEVAALQAETLDLVEQAQTESGDPDFWYRTHEPSGKRVPWRVEYPIERTASGKALLAHPFILRSVEKLQGPNFFPTWDAMVFKQAGAGVAVPWHRDAGTGQSDEGRAPIFNVDFYLDAADLTNCLWGILGTNKLPEADVKSRLADLNAGGAFHTPPDAVPIVMQPGDAILHNILTLHGSPAAQSHLRRVLYYEFRPAEIEFANGPHTPEYIPLKQKVLLRCLELRRATPYAADETPFEYRPAAPFDAVTLQDGEPLPTFRYPHEEYWRK